MAGAGRCPEAGGSGCSLKNKVPSASDSDKIPGGIGQLQGGLQIVREHAARKIRRIERRFARRRIGLVSGIDDRSIEEAVGHFASQKKRLDALAQLCIAQTLTIQDGGASRRFVAFDG